MCLTGWIVSVRTIPLPVFNVRLDRSLADRFDQVAADRGGRSALLRQVIEAAVETTPEPTLTPAPVARIIRVMVRVTAQEAAVIDREAKAMSLSRAGWIAALVRRRVSGRPRFSGKGEAALRALQSDLRRLAVNLNQIARRLNDGSASLLSDRDIATLKALSAQCRHQQSILAAALAGNLDYWADGDG